MTFPADPQRPPPEWLAGYADGELDAAAARRVRDWLAAHPDFTDDLAMQVHFSPANVSFWQSVTPAEPSEAAWADVAWRIQEAVEAEQHRPPPRRAFPWWSTLTGLGLAAGLALALLVPSPRRSLSRPTAADAEAWTLAESQDVEILSLRSDDANLLVVGRMPLAGPLELATVDELEFHTMAPSDGMQPEISPMNPGDVPMVVAVPLGSRR
jgi:hypothetical protein